MKDSFVIRLLLILVAAVILYALVMQYNKESKQQSSSSPVVSKERFVAQFPEVYTSSYENAFNGISEKEAEEIQIPRVEQQHNTQEVNDVKPAESMQDVEDYRAVNFAPEKRTQLNECYPKDRLTAEDLLPKDAANTKWAQVNPAGQGDLKDQNFLTAGFHIGINTVGQTLRNANLQVRSEPPNPKMDVGPWNTSTIEYDNSRRYFEVGEC